MLKFKNACDGRAGRITLQGVDSTFWWKRGETWSGKKGQTKQIFGSGDVDHRVPYTGVLHSLSHTGTTFVEHDIQETVLGGEQRHETGTPNPSVRQTVFT